MHLTRIGLITALLVSFGAGMATPALAASGPCVGVLAARPQPRMGQFTGNLTAGPDAGHSLSGPITLYLSDNGSATGTLAVTNGPTLAVTGKIAGSGIHLELASPDGLVIEGHGTFPQNCTASSIGGKLTGPHHPDRGDWGVVWGN